MRVFCLKRRGSLREHVIQVNGSYGVSYGVHWGNCGAVALTAARDKSYASLSSRPHVSFAQHEVEQPNNRSRVHERKHVGEVQQP